MVDGLGGFGQLRARFRASSAWATAGLAAVPFASALAGLSPPWPPGIVALTAVVQLLLLALAYLPCRGWSRRRTLPAMVVGILVAALAAKSEETRGGKECVSPVIFRVSPSN